MKHCDVSCDLFHYKENHEYDILAPQNIVSGRVKVI